VRRTRPRRQPWRGPRDKRFNDGGSQRTEKTHRLLNRSELKALPDALRRTQKESKWASGPWPTGPRRKCEDVTNGGGGCLDFSRDKVTQHHPTHKTNHAELSEEILLVPGEGEPS